jgi:hypothetical protein
MESQEILSFLRAQLDGRADGLASGIPGDAMNLALEYKYHVGIIHGLIMVREWVKDYEAKKLQEEISDETA